MTPVHRNSRKVLAILVSLLTSRSWVVTHRPSAKDLRPLSAAQGNFQTVAIFVVDHAEPIRP
jgi:hypothetical protein